MMCIDIQALLNIIEIQTWIINDFQKLKQEITGSQYSMNSFIGFDGSGKIQLDYLELFEILTQKKR